MKKTLTNDIRRYDDKMKLKFDAKTFRAAGISAAISLVIFVAVIFTAGELPAIVSSIVVFGVLLILQIGTIQGISLIKYLFMTFCFLFCPSMRKKPYCREANTTYCQIVVLTEQEQKQGKKG